MEGGGEEWQGENGRWKVWQREKGETGKEGME
jgi:hypothetical protein